MYEKGDLKQVQEPCAEMVSDGWCDHSECRDIQDSRADGHADVPRGTVFLPHSCNEWVIGGRTQIQALIKDLQAIINAEDAAPKGAS